MGYFNDACTIIECLHTFCRVCARKNHEESKHVLLVDVHPSSRAAILHLASPSAHPYIIALPPLHCIDAPAGIMRHFRDSSMCPQCEAELGTNPKDLVRTDRTLQVSCRSRNARKSTPFARYLLKT